MTRKETVTRCAIMMEASNACHEIGEMFPELEPEADVLIKQIIAFVAKVSHHPKIKK